MPARLKRDKSVMRLHITGPFKGWVPDYPPDEVPADAFSHVSNVQVESGRVRKMPGYNLWTTVGSGSNEVPRALARFTKEDGTEYGVVLTDNSAYEGTGDTFTQVGSSFQGTGEVDWTIVENVMVMTNGADVPQKYNGTTNFTALGGSPKVAKYCALFDDRLFLAYTTESEVPYPYRLRFSATGAPEDWTDNFVLDLISGTEPPEFSGISAVAPLSHFMAVYKTNSIWSIQRLSSSPWYQAKPLVNGIGCVGSSAICEVPEGHVFIGPTDVWFWSGSGAPQSMTAGIHDTLYADLDPDHWGLAMCAWNKEEDTIVIGVSQSGAVTDRLFVYDRRERTWSVMDNVAFTAIGTLNYNTAVTWDNYTNAEVATPAEGTWDDEYRPFDDPSFTPDSDRRFCGADKNGKLFELFTGDNHGGSAYTGRVDFAYLDFGDPTKMKRVLRVQPLNMTSSGTHNVSIYLGVCNSPYETPTWGSAYTYAVNTTTRPWVYTDRVGRYIVPRVETTAANEPFQLSGLVIEAVAQGEF